MSSDDPYKLEEQSGDTQLDQHLLHVQELKLFPYSLHTIDVSSVRAWPFMLQIVYTQDIWQGVHDYSSNSHFQWPYDRQVT